jgi:hypothetical protein
MKDEMKSVNFRSERDREIAWFHLFPLKRLLLGKDLERSAGV